MRFVYLLMLLAAIMGDHTLSRSPTSATNTMSLATSPASPGTPRRPTRGSANDDDWQKKVDHAKLVDRLRKSRSGCKALVTRVRNELKDIPEEPGNLLRIFQKVDSLNQAVMRFNESHDQYHSAIRSSEEVIDSSAYAQAVFRKAEYSRDTALAYIRFTKEQMLHRGETSLKQAGDPNGTLLSGELRDMYNSMTKCDDGSLRDTGFPPDRVPDDVGQSSVSGKANSSRHSASSRHTESRRSRASSGTSSTISSIRRNRIRVQAERVALEVQVNMYEHKKQLEREQVFLKAQREREDLERDCKLRAQREQEDLEIQHRAAQLDLHEKLARASAQERVYVDASVQQQVDDSKPPEKRYSVKFDIPNPDFQSTPQNTGSDNHTVPPGAPKPKVRRPRPSSIIPDEVPRHVDEEEDEDEPDLPVDKDQTQVMRLGYDNPIDNPIGNPGGHDTAPASSANLTTANLTAWQSGQEDLMRHMYDNTNSLQRSIVESIRLPKLVLTTFTGDPIQYYSFICAFEQTVHMETLDDASRLARLKQYCSDKIVKMIDCCSVMASGAGYKKAREILYNRFGEPFVIAEAWLQRIVQLKPDANGQLSLQLYADELLNCRETLNAMGHLGELNNSQTLLRLVEKLPQDLYKGWSKRADTIRVFDKRSATIDDFLEYVQTQARIASHPVFGKLYLNAGRARQPVVKKAADSFKRAQPKTFSTQAAAPAATQSKQTPTRTFGNRNSGKPKTPPQQPPPVVADKATPKSSTKEPCPYCSASHTLFECVTWKQLAVQDRLKFVRSRKMCVLCLSAGHRTADCTKQTVCTVPECGLRHTKLLHLPRSQDSGNPNTVKEGPANPGGPSQGTYATMPTGVGVGKANKVGLPIVPIKVRGDDGEYTQTYAMLDSCSTQTFCTEELAAKLEVHGERSTMFLTTLEEEAVPIVTCYVSLEVTDLKERYKARLSRVATKAALNISANTLVTNDEIHKWKHLRGIKLPEVDKLQIQLLIGQDYGSLFFPEKTVEGKFGEPYAVKTIFGWTIHGPLSRNSTSSVTSYFARTDPVLLEQVERFWKLDNLSEVPSMSHNDRQVVEIWEQSAVFQNGHFSFDIPFKERPPHLLDNKSLAERRLHLLGKRLSKDETFKARYRFEIEALISKGYAEKVPVEHLSRADGGVYYIPHHPVVNEKKPDKVRPVFDCAAKYGGSSLNDHVHQGPDLTNGLVGVMLRFRQEGVAFMADIEAMFHQVLVTERDRDALRFLWWENELSDVITTYRMTAHLFGGVWSPSVASFAVKRTASMAASRYEGETVKTVLNNFYVDDCLKSVRDDETAVRLVGQLRNLLAEGGFRLTKWVSNSREVLRSIPESERAKGIKSLDLEYDYLPMERALGLLWDVETDTYQYNTMAKAKPVTKRGILSVLCSVYDPLGFVSPFIMLAKMIFQSLCQKKLDWDDAIGEEEALQWGRWKQSLVHLQKFAIPRCVQPQDQVVSRQLHHFSDASGRAYGSATYLRTVTGAGQIYCALLMSKGRLTPLKTMTIPRLELTAAVLSTQLDKTARRELELEFHSSTFWTDSMIVLHYIHNLDARYQTFVANRLEKIRDLSDPGQWRHVRSEVNPADIISRGAAAESLVTEHMWTKGPNFLWLPENQWPEQPEITLSESTIPETKKETLIFHNKADTKITPIEKMSQFFSDWNKLQCSVAWLLRLKAILKTRVTIHGPLKVSELKSAEIEIVKHLQLPYGENCVDLKRLSPVRNCHGIICVGGRLSESSLSDRAKHPWVLPGHGRIVSMIIRDFHSVNGHAGVERCLADIRQHFWLVRGRAAVKRVVYGCMHCKKVKASPIRPRMADLPKDRLEVNSAPFINVGIDYFGPFAVKRARSTVKRYGCIFTCLVTRALHIEVAASLDTSSFINALQRFIARRGQPEQLRSDNGTNFVGAEKELRLALKELDQCKITNFLRPKGIQWHFNPPSASHMGGVWERQIRSIRAVLKGLTTQQTVDEEGLATLMCLVESILNGRPITKLSDDPNDDLPLTPNHLLLLRDGPRAPPGVFEKSDLYGKRWRQIQYLADLFWRRWVKEYLPILQQRQKWLCDIRNVRVGDLVLVQNELLPRNQWPLGRILEVYPGRDDVVRVVKVRYQGSDYIRPTSKLVMLEGVSDKPIDYDD